MTRSLVLKSTSRFVNAYDRAHPRLRACAHGALSDLRRAFEQRPDLALRRYNKLKGLVPAVLEVDIAGGERLLMHWRDGTVYLLEMGGHEVVKRYKATARVTDEVARCKSLPERIEKLVAVSYFTFDVDEEWQSFATEADPSWLNYLDDQQGRAADRILSRAGANQNAKVSYFGLLTGGPGTGKTSVLLNLFSRAWENELVPQMVVEDQVAEYIEASACIDIEPYRCTLKEAQRKSAGGMLLVDDPHSALDIERARWLARKREFKAVIVGVDPLQMAGDCDDAKFDKILEGSDHIPLHVCYRQKQAVGRATKQALDSLAASSRFLDKQSKLAFAASRRRVTDLVNNMEFANPAGRVKRYPEAVEADVSREVARLLRARGLWNHWPPYLIAFDDERLRDIPRQWKRHLAELPNSRTIPLSQSLEIKGVEFQHAIIIISEALFIELVNGFEGATREKYERRRLLRIPISRAKDSVTVFVLSADM
jgi:hypothetical protein